MNIRKSWMLVLGILFIGNTYCFAGENIIKLIYSQASEAIEGCDGQFVYLNPERVYSVGDTSFLESDYGKGIALQGIVSSKMGPAIALDRYQTKWQKRWICNNCTLTHPEKPITCQRCGNRSFTIRNVPKDVDTFAPKNKPTWICQGCNRFYDKVSQRPERCETCKGVRFITRYK